MPTIAHSLRCRILLGVIFAALTASAQELTSSTSSRDPAVAEDSQTVVLSPFTVRAEDDSGYTSSAVTAGSRLRTDLNEVAASVTVLTNDFMDDLASTDVAGALAFVSGAENDSTYHAEAVSELGGNNAYVGGDFGDNNNRSGEVRVRGLGRATTTVNFIEVLGSTDRYNIERSEFLRGANSILFGLAEPAGLINMSTKIANVARNRNRVETRLDNYGSYRAVLDINRVLLRDKLALRAVGLYSDTQYRVKSAYQKDERLFLTGTYKPFRGTTIRANFETQDTRGRRPNNRTVQDNVSEWLAAYNQYAPRMTPAQIEQAFFWNPTAPSANGVAPDTVFTLSDGTTVNLGQIRRPMDTNATGTILIYNGDGQWNDPWDNTATLLGNRFVNGALATPVNTRQQFMRTGSSLQGTPGVVANPQVTDQGIFPYETVEIGALPGNYRWEKDDKVYLNIDQRITDDLYFSASYQHEKRSHEQNFAVITQTNQISVDINRFMPDGRANPNFLRPFIYGRSLGEYSDATADNVVLQANYDFDFAKKTNRLGWLGFHRLTAVYNSAEVDRLSNRWNYRFNNDVPGALGTAGALGGANATQRWAMQMWYIGDPVQLGDTSLRLTGMPDTLTAHWDRSYDYLYYNNTVNPRVWQKAASPIRVERNIIPGGRTYTVQKNDGIGLSLQSYFLNRRIITLFGWRRDKVDSFQGIPMPDASFQFPQIAGTSRDQYLSDGNVFNNSQDTTTQSIVVRPTEWLRVFANRSENFAATTPRQDNLYRQLAPQSGVTKEVGFGLHLLDNKLDIRTTVFESSQQGATSNTAVAGIRIVAFEDALYNALESAGRLAEWTTISPQGGSTIERYERPNNAASTEDRVSKGASVEIAFRPNRNWEFVGSVDKIDNKTTNVGVEVSEFLAARASFYGRYFAEGLRQDGTTAAVSSSQLLQTTFVNTVGGNFVNELRKEGQSNRGLSDYTARLVGRYKFNGSTLKGLVVGGNVRWESGKVLGYGQIPATFNFGGLDNVSGFVSDLSNVYKGKGEYNGGMFASYTRKIFQDRITWKVQLNADNLLGGGGLRRIAANFDGSPVWAIKPPTSYILTNTFEF